MSCLREHRESALQRIVVQPAQLQALLEEFLLRRVLHLHREMLRADERLDDARDETLLVHVDQRLELHGGRERREVREHLGVRGRLERVCRGVDLDRLGRRGGVDQVGQDAESVQLGEVDT